MVIAAGVISRRATGTRLTTMFAVAYFPSLVASICATPSATAVTTPAPVTVATSGRWEVQVMVRPVIGLPAASASVAVSVPVVPTARVCVAGVTVTVATGTGGGGGLAGSLSEHAIATSNASAARGAKV